ncbi:hypothetical protein JHK87_026236 [Glycine soja]|nr:hypothetical protein JHK87_026236 [Glycine soja]
MKCIISIKKHNQTILLYSGKVGNVTITKTLAVVFELRTLQTHARQRSIKPQTQFKNFEKHRRMGQGHTSHFTKRAATKPTNATTPLSIFQL